jgi:hypothetical protein
MAIGLWALSFSPAAAQQQLDPNGIIVTSNSGLPLLVDGIETEKVPTNVSSGQKVCTPDMRMYKSEGERWIFKQWSTGDTSECITPTTRGTYRALYNHEVLLLIRSTAPGVQRSMWVTYGAPVSLKVPDAVPEGNGTRYRFQGWSEGETPFDLSNTIAPVKPTALEVKWTREHFLQVESTNGTEIQGTGWYADGSNVVLRAPDTMAGDSEQERWKFGEWQSASFPAAVIQNAKNAMTTFAMSGPYSIRASYDKQYLVHASSPFGTLKRDWINSGQEVVLEAPPLLDIVPESERLVFKRWDGMEGLLSPKISGKADKPIIVTAAYDRQVMLKVTAPHGVTGDGWQKAGSVATIAVPGSVPQMLLLKASFQNFGGYPTGQSTVQVLVNEPTNLTAVYRTEPDYPLIVVVTGIPLAGVLIFIGYRRGWRWSTLQRKLRVRATAFADFARLPVRKTPESSTTPELSTTHRNGVAQLPQPLGQQQHS